MMATLYNRTTGEIYMTCTGPDTAIIEAQLPMYNDAGYVLELVDAKAWYLPGGVKTSRPTMDVQVSSTTLPLNEPVTIIGIPKGTRAIGQMTSATDYPTNTFDETVDDGELEWSSAYPGTYTIELICFPYQPSVITLEVINL